MRGLFRLADARAEDPAVEEWLGQHADERGVLARRWFARLRSSGRDVEEVMHDGVATVCVRKAAFAYVGVFKTHVTLGFFNGATLPDPSGLLVGEGRHMRHVKLKPGKPVDETALKALIAASYRDIKAQLRAAAQE